jgi:hypothetical protein
MRKILTVPVVALFALMAGMTVQAPRATAAESPQNRDAEIEKRMQALDARERNMEQDMREEQMDQRANAIKEGRWSDAERQNMSGPRTGMPRGGPHEGPDRSRGWGGHFDGCKFGGRQNVEGCRSHGASSCPLKRWGGLLMYLAILHILLAIVVYKDMRRSDPRMNGIWVVIVVMGGLPATVAYGIMRLVMVKSSAK